MATPEDAARLIQDVIAELGWTADPAAIADGVRRLDIGLPAEDEFAVVCAWLGRCELIHKLDQQQVPVSSRDEFQVPDLLAKFNTAKTPVLIEVKTKVDKILSMQPRLLSRLQNYADLVGLPLLIAWKWMGIWVLFEPRHLTKANKNFNIRFGDAVMQSLMGVLAGDKHFVLGKGAGLHLLFRKEKLLGTTVEGDVATEQWQMVLEDVTFTGFDGEQRKSLPVAVESLLMVADLEQQEEHTETHMIRRYVCTERTLNIAHRALVQLLQWEAKDEKAPSWRPLLRASQVSSTVNDLSETLEEAMAQRVVYNVFNTYPKDIPAYIAVPADGGTTDVTSDGSDRTT
jgi:Holliday junction resolvase